MLEEALAPYVVRSLLVAVDHLVYVDNNDGDVADRTGPALRSLFRSEIAAGKLTVITLQRHADKKTYSNSIARNVGLDVLRAKGCDMFITADSDDVLATDGCAHGMVALSKMVPPNFRIMWDMSFMARLRPPCIPTPP
jgi:hypothetical protein